MEQKNNNNNNNKNETKQKNKTQSLQSTCKNLDDVDPSSVYQLALGLAMIKRIKAKIASTR